MADIKGREIDGWILIDHISGLGSYNHFCERLEYWSIRYAPASLKTISNDGFSQPHYQIYVKEEVYDVNLHQEAD